MSTEPRRFIISGKVLKIVEEILEDRKRFNKECDEIASKYGFNSYFVKNSDWFSGWRFAAFCNPLPETDLSKFRKPSKEGAYLPRAKEGKDIEHDAMGIKHCKLNSLWDELNYFPHPFGGNGGIYEDKELNNQVLFYVYGDGFKGHEDLKELKLSEYYAMIGK